MYLSNLSIRRPVFAAVLMLALVTLGFFSYRWLSVEMWPNVEVPITSVVTKYPGASPDAVEREVSKKIEEAVNSISGVKHIYSYSREGVSTVITEFRLEEKVSDAAQETRAKINAIRGQLPKTIEDPIIQKLDLNAMPIVSLAVQSDSMTPRELTILAEKRIKRRFESLSGVGKVDLVGSMKREVNIDIDPARLEALGLGVEAVVMGLRSENVNTPLGRLNQQRTEHTLRIAGKPERVDELRRMVIAERSGRPIRLEEVAAVRDGVEEQRSLGLVDGVPSVSMDILKQSGANVVDVVEAVRKTAAALQSELPPGTKLRVVRDGSTMIKESLADVKTTVLLGGILTILIVFMFINSWRSTVITGLTLPISVMSSFIIMKFMGMSINTMTLLALSLVIGLLIDDAIVVRENIVRHLEHGEDHFTAARTGTSEIGLAVFATTLSIVAVFVPVAFMRGVIGRFFFQFGITVAFAVLISLLVSFTLDPMLSSRWHDPAIGSAGKRRGIAALLERFNTGFERIADRFSHVIGLALDRRRRVLAVAAAVFIAGLGVYAMLEQEFIPKYDRGEFQVSFKTAPEASLAESADRLRAMLAIVEGLPGVDHTYSTIGAGDNGTVRSGVIYVKLKDRGKRRLGLTQLKREARRELANVPGVILSIEDIEELASNPKPLQVNLRGPEITQLKEYAAKLRDEIYKVPGIVDIEISQEHDVPEYRLVVDRDKALNAGFMTQDVVNALGALVGGAAVSTYEDEDGDSVDIRVRLPERLRQDPVQVGNLRIAVLSKTGGISMQPLNNFLTYETHAATTEINRQDLVRQVTVSANLDKLPIGTALEKIREAEKRVAMKPGYSVVYSGEAEEMDESFGYLREALVLAVLLVYFVLAAQFESFLEPLAIMLSLPLSVVGMAGMLFLTGDTVNIMSLIGLILLMGLVTKNAILLVDYAKVLRRGGMERREAVIKAARTRMRPIVMTTTAMIFGMLPLALAIGAGAEMRAPMARAVIGGLLTSSFLTLIVVPVVYTYFDDLDSWIRRKWSGEGKV
jgi:HAE1 family hydrophobic/amphiphilic exporter-1